MKNKKVWFLMAGILAITCLGSGCGCSLGSDKDKEVIVDATEAPEEKTEDEKEEKTEETENIAADVQSTTYTSADKMLSIQLPDATWSSKKDETDLLSLESPKQGKILIQHGSGDDMASTVLPNSADTAASLEQASGLENGKDFEIQDYKAEDTEGIQVYSYVTRYLNDGDYSCVINKYFANDQEYYSIEASVVDDADYDAIAQAVSSFAILGDSTLKAAAPAQEEQNAQEEQTAAEETAADAGTEQSDQSLVNTEASTRDLVSDEAISDTSLSRTIYANDEAGTPRVLLYDANDGQWKDFDGNVYDFVSEEDCYDAAGNSYYYGGEAADVYYMPVESGEE